jgi:two-component system CheB/CheR fusion protein
MPGGLPRGIVETVRDPLVVLDQDMRIMSANESFYRLFQVSAQAVAAIAFNDLGTGQLNVPELRKVLEEVLPKSQSFEDLEIECEFPKIGRKKLRLNARRIYERGVAKDRILLAMQGVTEKE